MTDFLNRFSLKTKLILLYSVLLILSVGVGNYYSYWDTWQLLIENKTSNIRARSKPIIEQWLTKNELTKPEKNKLSEKNALEIARDLTSRDAVSIVLNKKGIAIANGKRLPAEMAPLPINHNYFNKAVSGNNEISYLSCTNGKRILTILIPLRPQPDSPKIFGVIQISTSLSNINRLLFQHGTKQFFIAIVTLIIGILSGYWLIGLSLKELQKLSATCHEISKGDFTQKTDVKNRKGEIGQLANSFNLMTDKLKTLFHSQKEFATNAAHELLTPLTGLHGTLEVLLRGAQDDRETANRLSKGMLKEVNHLIRLCEQLLGLSRLENSANLHKKQIALNEFMIEFQRKTKFIAHTHFLILKKGPYIKLTVDPDMLEQILFNLLSNAIRYSPPASDIIIEWKLIPDFVEFHVIDKGDGISGEILPHLFEPFYRGNNRNYSNDKSTGLGLALTKTMIEAHGGNIRIDSNSGRGTTVIFIFPL